MGGTGKRDPDRERYPDAALRDKVFLGSNIDIVRQWRIYGAAVRCVTLFSECSTKCRYITQSPYANDT